MKKIKKLEIEMLSILGGVRINGKLLPEYYDAELEIANKLNEVIEALNSEE